jgi:hypothetical protein
MPASFIISKFQHCVMHLFIDESGASTKMTWLYRSAKSATDQRFFHLAAVFGLIACFLVRVLRLS